METQSLSAKGIFVQMVREELRTTLPGEPWGRAAAAAAGEAEAVAARTPERGPSCCAQARPASARNERE